MGGRGRRRACGSSRELSSFMMQSGFDSEGPPAEFRRRPVREVASGASPWDSVVPISDIMSS